MIFWIIIFDFVTLKGKYIFLFFVFFFKKKKRVPKKKEIKNENTHPKMAMIHNTHTETWKQRYCHWKEKILNVSCYFIGCNDCIYQWNKREAPNYCHSNVSLLLPVIMSLLIMCLGILFIFFCIFFCFFSFVVTCLFFCLFFILRNKHAN